MATRLSPLLVGLLFASGCLAQQPPPAYDLRTQVPAITQDRWLQPPPPLPPPTAVTRDSYMDWITRTYERGRESAWKTAGSPTAKYQINAARHEGFWYRATHDESRAKMAMTFFRGAYAYLTEGPGKEEKIGFNIICPAEEGYLWIKASPSLTAADHQLIHDYFNLLEDRNAGYEVGAMNRSMGWATGRMILTKLYPDDPRNPERKKYAEGVWNDWWQNRDTDENAEGYNCLWLSYLAFWLGVMDQEDTYQDPGLKKLIYRYLSQVSPLGVIPFYGDECGWNNDPGSWIALLENWARVYRDGRFKWAAHRMYEYTAPQEQQMWQWGNINNSTMEGLMTAYLAADETLAEKKPEEGSVLTYRKACSLSTREERRQTGYYLRVLDRDIPNKLILRNGWEPGSSFAQVELCPPMGHGHGDAGAIDCYVSQGSLLLSDTPYLVKDEQYHNCFVVKPNPRPAKDTWDMEALAKMQTTVPEFQAWPDCAYARVHITRYMGQPVTLDRRIWFLGDAGMWVQDTIEATEPYNATVGPAWQTLGVYGNKGQTWFNTCYQSIPVAYIWEQKYMMQWLNRPWDLLISFLPATEGQEIYTEDVTMDKTRGIVDRDLFTDAKLRIWCQKTGPLEPGTPVRFSTLLLPHAPTHNAAGLAAGCSVLRDTPQSQVLLLKTGGEQTWVGLNDQGERLAAGELVTDARRFLVTKGADGKVRWRVMEGRILGLAGEPLFAAEERKTEGN
jgi:hypothetical protein